MSESVCRLPKIALYIGSLKSIESGKSFQVAFFVESFDKNLSFIILGKLGKFHFQTLFTLQGIQKLCFTFRYLTTSRRLTP